MEENLPTTTSIEVAEMTDRNSQKKTENMQSNNATPTQTNATTPTVPSPKAATTTALSAKALKRCLSVPIIYTLPGGGVSNSNITGAVPHMGTMTTRSAAAAAAKATYRTDAKYTATGDNMHETPKKYAPDSSTGSNISSSIHIGIPRSNPCSREVSPAPVFNLFGPRARRYSASYSPLGCAVTGATNAAANNCSGAALCLTPRVSQLRQEECVDMNSREVNHEREVHSAMQMSQSWEDLTLVAENWSCKSDEFSNPLQVVLPTSAGVSNCSSPSPTSNRASVRLPYGLSPSPTRRTFATRRSMSPSQLRPSQLGPVKRKFELDDNNTSNWNVYSPPPLKKIFTESRGSSPIYQSPSSVCPSPDSGTYDGRITPKLFISKLCTNNNNNNNSSACSSPISASPSNSAIGSTHDASSTSAICSSISSSSSSGGSEPMSVGSSGIDEGISIMDNYEKPQCPNSTTIQPMVTDMQDEATLMDDNKSETSSIGGCSSISIESSSCDSGAKAAANFLNRFTIEDINITPAVTSITSTATILSPLVQKNFFINKQGVSGAKKYIVNHDNLPNTNIGNNDTPLDSIKVSSTTMNIDGGNNNNGVVTNPPDLNLQLNNKSMPTKMNANIVVSNTANSVIVENKI